MNADEKTRNAKILQKVLSGGSSINMTKAVNKTIERAQKQRKTKRDREGKKQRK